MQAILDPNVLVSGLSSADGPPARLLRRWTDGEFDLLVSNLLLTELERVLASPKIRQRIPETQAARFVTWLIEQATSLGDPAEYGGIESRDKNDDYRLALLNATEAVLVTGDGDLLELRAQVPVMSPADFHALLDRLQASSGGVARPD